MGLETKEMTGEAPRRRHITDRWPLSVRAADSGGKTGAVGCLILEPVSFEIDSSGTLRNRIHQR